jgi:predicted nucleic acid-binding protein
LCRLRREGKLTPDKYTEIRRAWLTHVEDAGVMPVNSAVIARAIELLERFPLRSSDAIQVASALEWSADCFISADERQCAAAKACGLKVERLR